MNVDTSSEGLGERLVAGQVREHAQFNLRIVDGDQDEAGLGDERRANLAAERRADRDVLQIRVAATETSRRGHRLIERRVDAPGSRIDEQRQGVDVRALEFLNFAPAEDEGRKFVRQCKLLEHLARGRTRPSSCRSSSPTAGSTCRRGLRRVASGELMLNSPPACL